MSIFAKSVAVFAATLLPTAGSADFTGGYAGAGISNITGDIGLPDALLDGVTLGIKEDTILTGFGGYQVQHGNLVYGGEIAFSRANDSGILSFGIEGMDARAVDIKGRVGYVLNEKVMAYGTVGFSRLEIDIERLSLNNDIYEANGFIIGAGIDYLATDNIVFGAEFTNRQVDGNVDIGSDIDVDLNLNSFTVRAAYKF
jgi:outer membrane immunogenic protein